ncbi:MAG: hypothetical protein QXG00_06970 [Candidatus Woesearchaeota archaeon]
MSTHSLIGLLYKEDSKSEDLVKYIYVHFDGYPSAVGNKLKNSYSSKEKLEQLINLGDCSSITPEIITYHSRGEDWECVKPKTTTLKKYIEIYDIDYVYLFDPIQNIWQCWNWNKTKIW